MAKNRGSKGAVHGFTDREKGAWQQLHKVEVASWIIM